MIPDGQQQTAPKAKKPREEDTFVAIELDVTEEDLNWLAKNKSKKKGQIWLSKKMSEKGKEVEWQRLALHEKKEFDIAQAQEIPNVVISKALRNLTPQERERLDLRKVMSMRWVLTRKGSGAAKARLVVLGFQAHNLTEVETASPTMTKVSRNLLLAATAAMCFVIKSGDVTSAFLQTNSSLENEDLFVWAPAELAAAFGATAGEETILKVQQAFYGLAHAPRKWFERCVQTLLSQGWKQTVGDKCLFCLFSAADGSLIGLAGLHVDDFLISGSSTSEEFLQAEKKLQDSFRWGKWEVSQFEFAGCQVTQRADMSIYLDQSSYTDKWIEEIQIDPSRAKKAALTPGEVSALRGALGTISWRATQSAPQYLAEASLLLSEINRGTVDTLHKCNKLVREMKRCSQQGLLFPAWGQKLEDLAVVTWADASQHNRPDKSSTVGMITAIAPKDALWGQEVQFALIQWKSGKTPRQCLGSNGAEVQSITMGEDQNYQIRALLAELSGSVPVRGRVNEHVQSIAGALVMDSRGIYDAMTRNLSSLHGLRDSRSGYELTLAVNQAIRASTQLRWVNGLAQLADALTKNGAIKVLLQFYQQNQYWRLVHDEKFTAGRKIHKREMEKALREKEKQFVQYCKAMAEKFNYPWDDGTPEDNDLLNPMT